MALGVSVLALPLLVGSCTMPGPSNDASLRSLPSLMRIADATRDGGDLRSAVGLYRRAHAFYPHAVEPLVALGQTLKQIGAIRQAKKAYLKALALEPADPDALHGLGGIYMSLGEAELALAQYEQLLAADPSDVSALNGKGVALDSLGRHREAQAVYRAGLEIEPERVALLNNLGLSLTLSGQYEDAIALLGPLAEERGIGTEPRKNLERALELAAAEKEKPSNRMTAAAEPASPAHSAATQAASAEAERGPSSFGSAANQPITVTRVDDVMPAEEEAPNKETPNGEPQQLVNLAPSALRAAALGHGVHRPSDSAPSMEAATAPAHDAPVQLAQRADGYPHGADGFAPAARGHDTPVQLALRADGFPHGAGGFASAPDGATQVAQADVAMPAPPSGRGHDEQLADAKPSALRVAAFGEIDDAAAKSAPHAASGALTLAERREIPVPMTHRADRPVQMARDEGVATTQERKARTRPDETVSLAPLALRNADREEMARPETANAPRAGRPALASAETLNPAALPQAEVHFETPAFDASALASVMPKPLTANAERSAARHAPKPDSRQSAAAGSADDGPYRVQLAAQRDVVRAYRSWSILSEQLSDLLEGYQPEVNLVNLGPLQGVFFRVRTDPPIARADADALCDRIKSRGADCFVAEAEPAAPAKAATPGKANIEGH